MTAPAAAPASAPAPAAARPRTRLRQPAPRPRLLRPPPVANPAGAPTLAVAPPVTLESPAPSPRPCDPAFRPGHPACRSGRDRSERPALLGRRRGRRLPPLRRHLQLVDRLGEAKISDPDEVEPWLARVPPPIKTSTKNGDTPMRPATSAWPLSSLVLIGILAWRLSLKKAEPTPPARRPSPRPRPRPHPLRLPRPSPPRPRSTRRRQARRPSRTSIRPSRPWSTATWSARWENSFPS